MLDHGMDHGMVYHGMLEHGMRMRMLGHEMLGQGWRTDSTPTDDNR